MLLHSLGASYPLQIDLPWLVDLSAKKHKVSFVLLWEQMLKDWIFWPSTHDFSAKFVPVPVGRVVIRSDF